MKKYLFFLAIFLIPIGSANALTYTNNNPTLDGYLHDTNNNDLCDGGTLTRDTAGNILFLIRYSLATADDCYRSFAEWDISSIPDGATITNVIIRFDVQTVSNAINCDYMPIMTASPTSASNANLWTDIGDGTAYVNNDATCTTAGNNKSIDLGSQADTDVTTRLSGNWFAVGFKHDNEIFDGTTRESDIASEEDGTATPKPTLEITYTISNGVTDLISTDIRPNGVDLDWTTPSGLAPDGYQVNMTTPWSSNVATIITDDTGTTTTSATISGLTGSTQYSFRIGSRVGTAVNATGNVLNVTTDFDPTTSFSTGSFSINFTGTDVRTIKYNRIDINSTDIRLNVTADNDFQLACNFHYKFAAINRTYTNIANTSVNANEDMVSFRFNGVDEEIIDVLCWDQYTNESARYLITQTNFPFLEQIENFRNGTYGTSGMFGAFDFISMSAIILSMIGLNRVNDLVGIIFGMFMVGVLALLSNGSIISWDTTFTTGFAVLIMWALGYVRKD